MLTLSADHKPHVLFLAEQSVQIFQDFCKLITDYLQKGPNLKLYTAAAQKLEVEPKIIQNCVEGVVYLLLECTKKKLSPEDFKALLTDLGFSDQKEPLLSSLYTEKQEELQKALSNIGFNLSEYRNMEWRFEVQIASRCLLKQIVPTMVMDFTLNNPSEPNNEQHILLQSDPANLLHLTQELEAAIQEGRSQYMRKIKRNIK